MSRTYRPFSEPILVLMLVLFLSASASAQTRAGAVVRRPRNANASLAGQSNPAVAISPGAWSQLGELAPNSAFDVMGYQVAIDGDTIAVGNYLGTAFIFTKPVNGWRNLHSVASLLLPTGITASIAMPGDMIVVGVGVYNAPGAAYVFVKPASGWTDMYPTATLLPSDSMTGDGFGLSVAISGDTIVVGANEIGGSTIGAAYIFVKPAGGWSDMTETAKITASDGQADDYFGSSVAISGNTVAVGASQNYKSNGKAYVFAKPASGWSNMTQTAELTASNGNGGDALGASISISNDTVLAGATNEVTATGHAYLFTKPVTGWNNMTQTAELSAADGPGYGYYFGRAVFISGKTAIVGAPIRSRGPNVEVGGVYVFSEPKSGWKDMAGSTVVTASDARHISWFGESLAMSGNTLVAGAPAFVNQGAAFVFGLPQ
jgi:hypothetical protein